MKKNMAIKNIVTSIFLQVVTIVYGFIIPKLILSTFGSEVNGLVSSITQLLSYISLVEGGITAVIIAKLYSPLVEKKYDEVSSLVVTGTRFFRKIGIVFIIYSLVLAIICPFFYMKNGFSYNYIFLLTIILSLGLLIQYMMSLGLKCLLNADKKVYYVSITQIIILIISMVLSYISIKIYPSIHIFKFLTGISYLAQPIMYITFVKKNYNLDKSAHENMNLIKDRWNGFANNVAYFIHTSTDITILTFTTNLITVSVYSVYSLVTTGLKSLIGAINTGLFSSIGHLYASGNYKELENKFDIYEILYLIIVFSTFTIASLLITPFVKIYVGTVDSIKDYYQPLFGYLICYAIMLDLVKTPHVNLSYAANKFKEITVPCFIEAIINVVLSLVMVFKFGLIGVAIGTIVAMLYRIFFQVYFTKKLINRKQSKFYKTFISFLITSLIINVACNYLIPININNINILSWIVFAIKYGTVTIVIYMLLSILLFKKQLNNAKEYFLKNRRQGNDKKII